jgi:hypothetical protein
MPESSVPKSWWKRHFGAGCGWDLVYISLGAFGDPNALAKIFAQRLGIIMKRFQQEGLIAT